MNQHQLSSLQLKRYFVTKLNFLVNESFDAGKDIVQKQGDFGVTSELCFPANDKEPFRIKLNVRLQPSAESSVPYSLALEIIGYFEQKFEGTKEEIVRCSYIQGSGTLYEVAREIVRATTSQSPFPPMGMPSISFDMPKFELPKQTVPAGKTANAARL